MVKKELAENVSSIFRILPHRAQYIGFEIIRNQNSHSSTTKINPFLNQQKHFIRPIQYGDNKKP